MRLQPDLKSFEYSDGCNSGARPYRSCIDSWGRYSHRDGGSLCRAIPFTRGCVQVYRAALNFELEAPPGFEPGMEVLQTSALPLGDGAGWNLCTRKILPRLRSGDNSET